MSFVVFKNIYEPTIIPMLPNKGHNVHNRRSNISIRKAD
jgi:hypothetical protein